MIARFRPPTLPVSSDVYGDVNNKAKPRICHFGRFNIKESQRACASSNFPRNGLSLVRKQTGHEWKPWWRMGQPKISASLDDRSPSLSDKVESNKNTSMKEKVGEVMKDNSGYLWLIGPIMSTAAIVIPAMLLPLADLLQSSYWLGVAQVFAVDLLFVTMTDIFFTLADKMGQHQKVPGGSPSWIAPWEHIGYPRGYLQMRKYAMYAGVGVALIAWLLSLILGKFAVALPIFGSYLALIFLQLAYEKLLEIERMPMFPLVAIVYTVYRFRQLALGTELIVTLGGGMFLLNVMKVLFTIWTFYLALHIAQLPWMYCMWNTKHSV